MIAIYDALEKPTQADFCYLYHLWTTCTILYNTQTADSIVVTHVEHLVLQSLARSLPVYGCLFWRLT